MRSGLIGLCLFVCVVAGCKKKDEVIVETAAGVSVTAAEIDRDPLALLPGGAVSVMRIDTQALYRSAFGQRLMQITSSRLPVPPSAGFEPHRDLFALWIGLYSMQGADFAGVASGNFNPASIEQAADGTQTTPLGAPLVKTSYAGRTLYLSRNIGFVVLTPRTVLFGNETGIRRALDRLELGTLERDVPAWLEHMLLTPNAAIVAGADLKGQPTVRAATGHMAFMKGLETVRVLGNFEPPGMHYAGTLTYPDPQTAQSAASAMSSLHRTLGSYSWFMQLAGLGNPIHHLEAQAAGNETQFVLAIDGRTVEWLINQLADQLGVSRAPIQATTTPAVSGPAR